MRTTTRITIQALVVTMTAATAATLALSPPAQASEPAQLGSPAAAAADAHDGARVGPAAPADHVEKPREELRPADPQIDAAVGACIGSSLVYKTSTEGGRANGEGNIVCTLNVQELLDTTGLWRLRFYGWQFLDSDSSFADDDHVVSISIWRCAGVGTYTYYSDAVHYVKDYSDVEYWAETSNSKRFSC